MSVRKPEVAYVAVITAAMTSELAQLDVSFHGVPAEVVKSRHLELEHLESIRKRRVAAEQFVAVFFLGRLYDAMYGT